MALHRGGTSTWSKETWRTGGQVRSGTRGRAAFRVNGKWEWARYGLGAGLGAQPRVERTWCCPHHPGQGAVCHFDGGGGRQQPYGGTVYPPESGRQLSHCNGLTCPFLWRKAEYSENTTRLQCCTGKKKVYLVRSAPDLNQKAERCITK